MKHDPRKIRRYTLSIQADAHLCGRVDIEAGSKQEAIAIAKSHPWDVKWTATDFKRFEPAVEVVDHVRKG